MIYPLPEKLILDFAASVDEVIVLEELDPFIEEHCKQLGIKVKGKDTFPICGEFSQNLVRNVWVSQKFFLSQIRLTRLRHTINTAQITAVVPCGGRTSSVRRILCL